ncbi:hypothetical protein RRG08_061021 [Elysia crispata]|uniref:Secreted protein n=1 Tax=Elysia crispata TaxID=231223 RepID=A0AAE1AWX5_9GAST|nr:hypothetical protein RRG08_061021 [Elysia crispata]
MAVELCVSLVFCASLIWELKNVSCVERNSKRGKCFDFLLDLSEESRLPMFLPPISQVLFCPMSSGWVKAPELCPFVLFTSLSENTGDKGTS